MTRSEVDFYRKKVRDVETSLVSLHNMISLHLTVDHRAVRNLNKAMRALQALDVDLFNQLPTTP